MRMSIRKLLSVFAPACALCLPGRTLADVTIIVNADNKQEIDLAAVVRI
jgi:hypothetical protein